MEKIKNKKELKSIRSKLRRTMTAPELILWQKIRGKQLGVKFRRQFSVGKYILDFFSPMLNLAIEIDGDTHYTDVVAINKDEHRDSDLKKQGIKVLRFTNHEVMTNLNGVIEKIIASTPSLSPPYHGGERGGEHTPAERSKII